MHGAAQHIDVLSSPVVWLRMYAFLARQLMRGRTSSSQSTGRGEGTLTAKDRANKHVGTESAVLDSMTKLLSLGAVSSSDTAGAF